MLILPDRNIPRAKFLLPVAAREWRAPSRALAKDQFGNPGVQTLFRVRARLHDGFVVWCGWFDDREDADAFLWALGSGSLQYEYELWRLPSPWWDADLGDGLSYDFATVTFLTSPTGSNQTYTSPSDWNNNGNTIEGVGAGATGGVASGTHGTGGGGACYSAIANFSFATPGVTTATYRIAAQIAGVAGNLTSGSSGSQTWFNDTVNPGAGTDNTKCSARGGTAGAFGTGSQLGGAGGDSTLSWGQTKFDGGRGGNLSGASGSGGSGAGGAAGPAGAGGNGVDSSSTGADVVTNGGTANNGTTAGGTTGGATGNPGNAGTEWDGSHGLGSGGAGASNSAGVANSGAGGLYGGASGGARSATSVGTTSGAGKQGILVITYTPRSSPMFTNRRIFLPPRRRFN